MINCLIFVTDISFTRFRPSVIAASAVVVACRLLVREENARLPPHLRCRLKFIQHKYVEEVVTRQNESVIDCDIG